MRDEHDTGREPVEEALEPVEAGEVEVVRRLVEQEHVEAGEQDRGERRASRLAAGERRELALGAPAEPDVVEHRARAGVEVLAAEQEVALERLGVGARQLRLGVEPRRERVHLVLRRADARAPREVAAHRLARPRLGLLRQVADRARRARPRRGPAPPAPRGRGAGSTCRSRSGRRCRRGRPATRPARRGRAPARRHRTSRCCGRRMSPARTDLLQIERREEARFRSRDPSWCARRSGRGTLPARALWLHCRGSWPSRRGKPRRPVATSAAPRTRSRRRASTSCPQCGSPKRAHRVCPTCGTYKGREVEPLRLQAP